MSYCSVSCFVKSFFYFVLDIYIYLNASTNQLALQFMHHDKITFLAELFLHWLCPCFGLLTLLKHLFFDQIHWLQIWTIEDFACCRYRIGPFEVESALIEHPAVMESAVVSSPDAVRGEVSCIYYQCYAPSLLSCCCSSSFCFVKTFCYGVCSGQQSWCSAWRGQLYLLSVLWPLPFLLLLFFFLFCEDILLWSLQWSAVLMQCTERSVVFIISVMPPPFFICCCCSSSFCFVKTFCYGVSSGQQSWCSARRG